MVRDSMVNVALGWVAWTLVHIYHIVAASREGHSFQDQFSNSSKCNKKSGTRNVCRNGRSLTNNIEPSKLVEMSLQNLILSAFRVNWLMKTQTNYRYSI